MQGLFSDFFDFTKQERRGVLWLTGLILLVQVSNFFYGRFFSGPHQFPREEEVSVMWYTEFYDIARKETEFQLSEPGGKGKALSIINPDSLFLFDPNTLPAEGWRKMGLSEKASASIRNYIDKGGRFRQPEDLRKIYLLQKDAADKLIPFVRIAHAEKEVKKQSESAGSGRSVQKININDADSAGFASLPGIGPVLAARTVAYRKRLGGFLKKEQIREVYGVKDSLFKIIEPFLLEGNCCVPLIRINLADEKELARHPYMDKSKAALIVNYRRQHGFFRQTGDLEKLVPLTPDFIERISPYLDLQTH